jgi:hypothetical protein
LNDSISSHSSSTIGTIIIIIIIIVIVIVIIIVIIIGIVGRVGFGGNRSKIFFRHDTRRNDQSNRRSDRSDCGWQCGGGLSGADGFHRRGFVEIGQVAVCVVVHVLGGRIGTLVAVVVFAVTLSNAGKKKKKKRKGKRFTG